MFKVRQLHVEQQASHDVINLENNLSQSHQQLSNQSPKSDPQLDNETAWLTSTVIDAAQKLLKALP